MQTEADTDRAISIGIGPHRLASRAFLAPMAGITDLPVRRMAMRFGAGLAVSEMIASDWLASGDPSALLRAEGEGVGLHVVQLAGCEAHWLAEGARIAEAAGADIIDINMGCPAKSVTNGQLAGAALLRDVEQATRMIAAVVAAVSVPVTLKMRLGWDENSIVAPELARRAEGEGVKMITVHGRTRAQFYNGEADWEAIARVRSEISVPLVANGDLTTYEDASEMRALANADCCPDEREPGQRDFAYLLDPGERHRVYVEPVRDGADEIAQEHADQEIDHRKDDQGGDGDFRNGGEDAGHILSCHPGRAQREPGSIKPILSACGYGSRIAACSGFRDDSLYTLNPSISSHSAPYWLL